MNPKPRQSIKTFTRRSFVRGAGVLGLGFVADGMARGTMRVWRPAASEPALTARLLVDTDRRLGTIDPNL
ncbi:MAG: hypothetical protein HYS61_08290, partial [Acidobacteria bacterium]|nr:hypothetical protein [Acidobacteriota bacterium]